VAFVSLEIAAAVAVPPEDAPNGVALNPSVATAVPGDATELGEILNTRLPDAPSSEVTASVAAFFAAVECVTAICRLHYLFVLLWGCFPRQYDVFGRAVFARNRYHRL
jgi:hypothetical protein